MEKITNITQLRNRIDALELSKDIQEIEIKQDVRTFIHSLRPGEIVKNILQKITNSGGENEGSALSNLGFGLLSRTLGIKTKSMGGAFKSVAAIQIAKMLYNQNQDKIHEFLGNMGGKLSHWLKKKADKMHDKVEQEKLED
jgi:hypothetical protein